MLKDRKAKWQLHKMFVIEACLMLIDIEQDLSERIEYAATRWNELKRRHTVTAAHDSQKQVAVNWIAIKQWQELNESRAENFQLSKQRRPNPSTQIKWR